MSACVICGQQQATLVFTGGDRLYGTTPKDFDVVRCAGCGLLRLDPQPTPEELRHYYPDNYWFAPNTDAASRLEELYRRVVLRDHVAFVARALRQANISGPLLDAGCGGGLFLGLMRQRGFRVLGLDFSANAASIAWRQQGAPAVCAMLDRAPFPPHSIGALTMFHVVEHLTDPRAYLTAARNLLQPNGRLIVQVPNANSWQAKILGRRWNGMDVPRHIYDYRDADLEKLLSSCGFAIVRKKYFSLRDNPAGLASSLAPALDPMARRVRRVPESGGNRLMKDLAYLALTVAALPFAAAEAAFRAGSSVMVEARPQ